MTFNFKSSIGISVSMSRVSSDIDWSVGGYQGKQIENNSTKWIIKVNTNTIGYNTA